MIEMNAQTEKIVNEFLQLSPEQQVAVAELIHRLSENGQRSEKISFLAAVDEFMDEHPELLKRLAQ